AELAATTVLRLRGLQAEEEAFLAREARRDPRARAMAAEIAGLRGRLANLFHAADNAPQYDGAAGLAQEIATVRSRLQAREFDLGRISPNYGQHLRSGASTWPICARFWPACRGAPPCSNS